MPRTDPTIPEAAEALGVEPRKLAAALALFGLRCTRDADGTRRVPAEAMDAMRRLLRLGADATTCRLADAAAAVARALPLTMYADRSELERMVRRPGRDEVRL